jgi:PAS domain S-box-containing protein
LQKVREHITDLLARRDRVAASLLQSRQLTMEFEARTKEAMKALRETEEEYRSFVRTLHEIIFRIDLEGNFSFLNDAWEEVTGFTTRSSIGKSAVGFVHDEDRTNFQSVLRSLAGGARENVRAELRMPSAEGEMRWLELRARRYFGADNTLAGISGTLEDVTARRDAQEALRRSEAASRGLLAALPDEVLLVSREGVVLSHEGGDTDRMHGESAVGSTIEQVFPGAVAQAVREFLGSSWTDSGVHVQEYHMHDENEDREFEVRLAASGDDAAVAVIRNVTHRKLLEAQLRQSQKLEAIGRLAAGLAHDFNNLLTVVQGNAYLLEEETRTNAAALDYVRQIGTAAERGATLVRQLLAFGRRQVLQPTTLDLNELVDGTRSMLRRLIGEHILLEVDLDPDVGPVKADVAQIEQVLVNLAVNAREMMHEHGTLRISTRNGALVGPGIGHDAPPDNTVLLTVSDNGPGMDAETRERIFEPFFTTRGLAESSGLRLATVYGIIRQSGGTIAVQSEPGQGTTFEISLPRADH